MIVIGLLILWTVSCSSYGGVLQPPVDGGSLPTCSFDAEDTVRREGVGAVVPDRGSGVAGSAETVNGGSASIEIEVAPDGVVTITSSKNGVRSAPTSCVLP